MFNNLINSSISPSEIIRSNRFSSPVNITDNMTSENILIDQNLRSKSHVKNNPNNLSQHIDEFNQHIAESLDKGTDLIKNSTNSFFVLNKEIPNVNCTKQIIQNVSSNVTIWREELNTRKNVQQQIKKQV